MTDESSIRWGRIAILLSICFVPAWAFSPGVVFADPLLDGFPAVLVSAILGLPLIAHWNALEHMETSQ